MNLEIKVWKETNCTRWGKIVWKISNYGEVYKNDELFECRIDKCGYKRVTGGYMLHKLVAELFLEKPISDEKLTIDHIDGDKLNNRADNLRYCTQKENIHNPITYTKMLNYLHSDKHKEMLHNLNRSSEWIDNMAKGHKGKKYKKHLST